MSFDKVEREITAAIDAGVFPGAVLLVRDGDRGFYRRAFGRRQIEPTPLAMTENTIFDVSSLTKAFATSVAVMRLVAEGKVRLDDKATRFIPNFAVYGKAPITIRHLLSHASGLRAWRPFFEEIRKAERHGAHVNFVGSRAAKEWVYQEIQRERPENPPGRHAVYSDVGFMLLGALVEELGAAALDRYCATRLFRPLGLHHTTFVDLDNRVERPFDPEKHAVAATEHCPWRGTVLCGVVHDDNAWAMGGVAGHAGLFSTADDLDTMLVHLRDCYFGRAAEPLVPSRVIREFWSLAGTAPDSTWCLGWDTPSAEGSSAGSRFSRHSVGHLGFTGVSAWLDLDRERHVILLTNRVHPRRSNEAIKAFRPRLHDLVAEALGD
jgi:CubicO group peptidase (beta-lactamase class C family)